MDENPIVKLDSEASKLNKKLLMKGEVPPAPVIPVHIMSTSGSNSNYSSYDKMSQPSYSNYTVR